MVKRLPSHCDMKQCFNAPLLRIKRADVLPDFEGKKVEEVAKEVGLSKSAAQGRLRHAEGALRRQYRKKIRT